MAGKRHFRRYLPTLIGTLVVLSIGGLVTWGIVQFMQPSAAPPKKTVQQITLVTPPPPPPPPKTEAPPPPPEIKPDVKIPEPENVENLPEVDDNPPLGDELGLDAEGGAGGDGFGLVGRKGGRGLLSGGAFSGFSRRLQDDINDALREHDDVRRTRYSVIAALWIGEQGRIQRVELQKGTGKTRLDDAIVNTLLALHVSQTPPLEMPQPIRIRITSRL